MAVYSPNTLCRTDIEDLFRDYFVPYFKDDHKDHYTYHVELMKLSEGCWRNMEAEFNYSWIPIHQHHRWSRSLRGRFTRHYPSSGD